MSSKIVVGFSSLILVLAGCSSSGSGTNTNTGAGAGGLGGLLGGNGAKDGGATGNPMNGLGGGTGTPTNPTTGTPTAGTCKLTTVTLSDNTCGKCQEKSCCSQWQKCDGSQECLQLLNCVVQCNGDETCENQCAADYPDKAVQQGVIDLAQCVQTSCNTACN